MALHVVFYESAPDALALIPHHYPAHRAWVDDFHARGELLWSGRSLVPARVERSAQRPLTS